MAKKNKNSAPKSGAAAAEKSPREQETSEASTGAEDTAATVVASPSALAETQGDATSSAPAAAAAEVESLRQRLDAANQEIAALKAQLAQRDAEVTALKAGGAGGGLSGLAPSEDIQSLQVCPCIVVCFHVQTPQADTSVLGCKHVHGCTELDKHLMWACCRQNLLLSTWPVTKLKLPVLCCVLSCRSACKGSRRSRPRPTLPARQHGGSSRQWCQRSRAWQRLRPRQRQRRQFRAQLASFAFAVCALFPLGRMHRCCRVMHADARLCSACGLQG